MATIMPNSSNNVAYYNTYRYNSINRLNKVGKMHGVKRVIVFCIMTTILPTILIITPLYLRHSIFADVSYPVAESDVLAITDGMSTIFCQSQSLRMNTTFNAFQLRKTPELSKKRKHIRLKKSMTLPDDTLEYWGFYLLKGATVSLKVCSRYEGSRILVVRGEKNLRTCGLMEHNYKKFGATMDQDYKQVKVTFEHAQEIDDSKGIKINKTEQIDLNIGSEDTNVDEFVKKRLNKSKKNTNVDNKKPEAVKTTTQISITNINNSENILNDRLDLETTAAVEVTEAIEISEAIESRHPRRHSKKKFIEMQEELYRLQQSLKSNEDIDMKVNRHKREINQILDGGIEHGGNAINYNKTESKEDSVSSFETDLLTCYDGSILLTQGFSPSHLCTNVHYLELGEHMETKHEVVSDGYYYYIFYSDNDFITNDIHAVFDIYKPTFQYMNNATGKECINSTQCFFPVNFLSDETVIVEVPTHDGIEHEEDHIDLLISTCHPRMVVYIIFPISVMILILGCAFL